MKIRSKIAIFSSLLVSACISIPTPVARQKNADNLAQPRQWHAERLQTGAFDLIAYVPDALQESAQLSVYIEGDGFAWITDSQPSLDPTPLDPLGLRLALAQPEGGAAYLARPCQYVDALASQCAARYWTGARFAEEVIAASNAAIDMLKHRFQAQRLILVGYSGGAAIAALVAARRKDVALLVSVAGNLDTVAWARYHHLQPLLESLNPIDAAEALRNVPQIHFAGGKDPTIPPELVHRYAREFARGRQAVVFEEQSFDHHCCWAEQWPALWHKTLAQRPVKP